MDPDASTRRGTRESHEFEFVAQAPASATILQASIDRLASEQGATRRRARVALVALGAAAVPALIRVLQESSNVHARWGAVKVLGAIGDARAIPVLVAALEDDDHDVAWLAADALRSFRKSAWPTLLRRLIRHGSHSILLRRRAHYVLKDQSAEGFDQLLDALMEALASYTLAESTAMAAYEVLHQLEAGV